MPTIIDSLIVELDLDPSKFTQKNKDAIKGLRDLEDGASKHIGKAKEESGKLDQALGVVQGRLLALAAIFTGGMGLARFTEHITNLTAQTGYLAKNLGVSAQELTKWESAGVTVGAQANEIAQSFAAIQKSMAQMQLTGQSPLNAFAYSTHQAGQGPSVELYGKDGKWRPPTDILTDISKWASAQPNKAVASQMLSQLGMGQGMTNLLMLGPDELQKRLKAAEQFAPSDDQIQKFQAFQKALNEAALAAETLSRTIIAKFVPAMAKILEMFSEGLKYFIKKDADPDNIAKDLNQRTHGGFNQSIFGRMWQGTRGLFGYGRSDGGGDQPARGFSDRFGSWNSSPSGSSPAAASGGGAAGSTPAPSAGGGVSGSGGAAVSAAGGEGGSEFMRRRRERYMNEVNSTPGLKDRIGGMLQLEGTPQGSMESLLNRMDYVNSEREAKGMKPITIDQMLNSGFYGPINRGELPGGIAAYQRSPGKIDTAMSRAFGGSTSIGAYTDQGLPSDPNGWRQPQMRIGGNVFTDWNGAGRLGAGDYRNAAAYRDRMMAGIAAERSGANKPSPLLGQPASGGANSAFRNWQNLGLGARGAVINGGSTSTSTSSSSTHIGEMNVSVPPGADPSGYASGIRQELQRFDNVQQANTGLF